MADHTDFDESASRRNNVGPYTPRHPVPTIQGYEAQQEERQAGAVTSSGSQNGHSGESKIHTIIDTAKSHFGLNGSSETESSTREPPYDSQNRNIEQLVSKEDGTDNEDHENTSAENNQRTAQENTDPDPKDTSESTNNELDPRQKRKHMKHMTRDSKARQVTDPITHLPVTIHDSTGKELKSVPENMVSADSTAQTPTTDFSATSKSDKKLEKEAQQSQTEHRALERLFPPPNLETVRQKFGDVYGFAVTFGIGMVLFTSLALLALLNSISLRTLDSPRSWFQLLAPVVTILVCGLAIGGGMIWGLREWLKHKVDDIWQTEVWGAAKTQEQDAADSPIPESTQWLNSILVSVWSLINPDLFASLADTLEDVMQASLPKLVRMISVEDLGQGSEAIRILGIRWLPPGAAAKDVSVNGKIKSGENKKENDRKIPGQGQAETERTAPERGPDKQVPSRDQAGDDGRVDEDDQEDVAEGMEAEEGDFVNLEVAFSYRASSSGKSLKVKSKNAHIYLAFYLPGGIRLPVWVELRGIVVIMRMRLQLCPDPPFFALCTLTLLGQPKADLSCVPLTKKGLNIMDLPIISSFVQSSIDAALAEYVAPKSLTLDLKDMLVGDDFKKDTSTHGIIMIKIRRAEGFKEGDGSIGRLKKGSSDAYVAVGWAKFGKPVWSTRVIERDMEPVWDETAFVLVGPEEINADERLRVQLWDSDRSSADDDLGRIEVDLKELIHGSQSNGKMWDRHDTFLALDGDEGLPGSLDWSVGYYSKTRIQEVQLRRQKQEPDVKNMQQFKEKVSNDVEQKTREATEKDNSTHLEQQKARDLKMREDDMIISVAPLGDYPTGIFSIQIHQIIGLEYEKTNKSQSQEDDESETEGGGDIPSSYCTVTLNHQKIFKTRTKPKNAKPFFNAGTERLIRDWRSTEVIISVRDSRIHENDPLLGIVYLPLSHIFHKRSQIIDNFPLVGGIGYGRARISMVFRSIQLQAPKELLGWDYGTLEITGPITSSDISTDLQGLRFKLRTSVSRAKMYASHGGENAEWRGKKDRPVRLAVRKRYCTCLVIEFRKSSLGLDKTPAFTVLWLKDVSDEEETTVNLPVWRGDASLKRAETNCVDNLGEKMGTISVPLRFWRGLSRHHHKLASKSPNLQDVFEVLATANDNEEVRTAMYESGDDSSSESDSSDDDPEVVKGIRKQGSKFSAAISGHDDGGEDDGKRGPLDQLMEYKDHSDQLHRRHRGLMQWKGARTANWMKTKVQHGKEHVLDNFRHHERDSGIETEV